MSAVLRHISEVRDPDSLEIRVPNSPHGRRFRYLTYLPGGDDLVFSDTLEETLPFLISGYDSMTDETDKAASRIMLADSVARILQSEALLATSRTDHSEEEWAALHAPRIGSNAVRADWWRCLTPLYVVETSYQPYTDLSRPASTTSTGAEDAIRWIRPAEEEDFLLSLDSVGYLRIMENSETAEDTARG